jgi:hypothetical protein
MAVARVVRDEVEQDANPAPARVGDELVEVREGTEDRIDAAVVGDVVAPVGVRRRKHRAQPERVDA